MHARGVELVAQVRAPGAGAVLVVRPEHDVVGEQLRASVEELGEGLLAVLGVELVLLLHRDPGQPAALLGHLLAELGVLGLELRELVARRLPLLARSDRLVGHRRLLCRLPLLDRRATPKSSSPRAVRHPCPLAGAARGARYWRPCSGS